MHAIVSGVIVTATIDASSVIRTVFPALILILASFMIAPSLLRLVIWLLQRFDLAEAKLLPIWLDWRASSVRRGLR